MGTPRVAGEHARSRAVELAVRLVAVVSVCLLVPSRRGNVDHILVGPGGVFTIETKSRRGPVRVDRVDPRWLKQAYAERKSVERITSGHEVQALLVFSEAWLVGSVPARREGVTVLPARMLAGYLSRRAPVMSVERAREVTERLAAAVGQGGAPAA